MPLNVKQWGPGAYCCAAGMLYTLSPLLTHTSSRNFDHGLGSVPSYLAPFTREASSWRGGLVLAGAPVVAGAGVAVSVRTSPFTLRVAGRSLGSDCTHMKERKYKKINSGVLHGKTRHDEESRSSGKILTTWGSQCKCIYHKSSFFILPPSKCSRCGRDRTQDFAQQCNATATKLSQQE